MKRIAISCISVILGVCLLGAAGWGVFNYISLGQTIDQQKNEIHSLSIQKTDLQNEVYSLEIELTDETNLANALRSQYEILQTHYSNLQKQLEAATFRLGKDMLVMPRASPEFDCDDSAIYMYEYFTSLGYKVRIVTGNLDMTGETFAQCNHVWVWVTTPTGGEIAYDWGKAFTDEQHLAASYVISYKDLLLAAWEDY
jgi:hypothetical protein